MTHRRRNLLYICILCFFLLTGGLFATVEIKTKNGEPLINLDELLAGDQIGQPGSSNDGSLVSPPDGEQDSDGVWGQDRPNNVKTINLSIWDKNVIYKGNYYTYDKETKEIENFDRVLQDIADNQVIIQDNYAEAHTYRCALEQIRAVVQDDSRIVRVTVGEQEDADEK